MVARLEKGLESSSQIPEALSRESLRRRVGPDYKELADNKLISLGILQKGQSLKYNYPSSESHPGSDSEYLYEGRIGDDWVFLYLLEYQKGTSIHRHVHEEVDVLEDYYLLRGQMTLLMGKNKESLEKGEADDYVILDEENNHTTIPVDTYHTASAYDRPAYVLVVMPNTGSLRRDELHVR